MRGLAIQDNSGYHQSWFRNVSPLHTKNLTGIPIQ
jgi:hypothetical protein